MLQRSLGLLRDVVRKLERLAIKPLHFASQPRIKRAVRRLSIFFLGQEALDLFGVLHLLFMVGPLSLRNSLADLRGAKLFVKLLDFRHGEVALVGPILFPTRVITYSRGFTCLVSKLVGPR